MNKLHCFLIIFLILLSSYNPSKCQLPVDSDGWTIIEPTADSKIIYVSSSEGDDNNDGLSPETPVASVSKAKNLARAGYPDHILFRCGDEWTTEYGLGFSHSGKSAEEPTVISYYGDSRKRPKILCDNTFFYVNNKEVSHVAFIGLEFYAYKHDPNSPDYMSQSGQSAISYIKGSGENILIEDCKFNYMQMGAYTASEPGSLKNFKFRRNIIFNSWAGESYYIHELRTRVQGMYIDGVEGIVIEENLFDHNGWNEQIDSAGPNMFNHNIYMQGSNPNPDKIHVRGNILARPSAHGLQLRSGGHCEDNLFVMCAVNVNVGYDYIGHELPYMLDYVKNKEATTVRNNVLIETRQMDSTNISYPRTAARMGIHPIHIPCIVENNILANSLNRGGNAIREYEDINNIGGSVDFANNIVYKWYSRDNSDEGETTDPGWLDPERKVAHYHQSIGKKFSTIEFLLEARKRPLRTWWDKYSAYSVNQYIRDGFSTGTDNTPPSPPDSIQIIRLEGEFVIIKWPWAIDNVRVKAYNVYVDGNKYNSSAITTDTVAIINLNAGTSYSISVKSIDVAGNVSEKATTKDITTVAPDTEPPTVPANIQVVERNAASIKIKWNPSSDDRLLAGYNVFLNGEIINEGPVVSTEFVATDLLPITEYTLTVTAVDGAGNESDAGNTLTVRTLDTESPSSPSDVEVTEINSTNAIVSWSPATDNYQLKGYNIYLNGEFIGLSETELYTIEGLQPGENYKVNISAIDMDDNESRKTAPVSFTTVSTSIQSTIKKSVIIYPVPTSGKLFLQNKIALKSLVILNLLGKQVLIEENMNKGLYEFVISGEPRVYILKTIDMQGRTEIFKIIKSNRE